MRKHVWATASAATLALILAAGAAAHVTIQPDTASAGGFTRLDVRVPNESDKAATDKVEVQMPDGFAFASYEPVAGWKVEVQREQLAEPLQTDDGEITEQVKEITWTATDPAAAIAPGQFRDFGLSVGLPESAKEGDVLAFPAIQSYDDGEVVRWIGPADSDAPAPHLTLTAAEADHHAAPAAEPEHEESADDDEEGSSHGLAIAALIVGALALVVGGTALVRGRRG